jgi:hypothetical protein
LIEDVFIAKYSNEKVLRIQLFDDLKISSNFHFGLVGEHVGYNEKVQAQEFFIDSSYA